MSGDGSSVRVHVLILTRPCLSWSKRDLFETPRLISAYTIVSVSASCLAPRYLLAICTTSLSLQGTTEHFGFSVDICSFLCLTLSNIGYKTVNRVAMKSVSGLLGIGKAVGSARCQCDEPI